MPWRTYRGVGPTFRPGDSPESPESIAFSKLFDLHFGDLWRFVRRRVSSAADADDLTADVFTIAWRRFDQLPPLSEQRLWLFGVARNVLQNHRRSTFRRQRLANRLAEVRESDRIVDLGERDDSLWVALSQLAESDRDLLIMRAWDQLTVGEIASLLDCSPNAVSLRLRKARSRLRLLLDEKDPDRDGDEAFEPATKGESR